MGGGVTLISNKQFPSKQKPMTKILGGGGSQLPTSARSAATLVYKIPYRRAPRLACRVRRASKGILNTTATPILGQLLAQLCQIYFHVIYFQLVVS